MDNKMYGIEIIRAYELSWLNVNGKPQLGVLEIKQDFGNPAVDTWKLKSFLESISNKQYNNIEDVKLAIYDCINIDSLYIVTQENFSEVKYFDHLVSHGKSNYVGADFYIGQDLKGISSDADLELLQHPMSFGLRFICQHSHQPYIGTVNIISPNTDSLNISNIEISNIINSFRNLEIVPQTLVNSLFNVLYSHFNDNFILSVHLNRRGGISYQALCSNKPTDFSLLSHRSILE